MDLLRRVENWAAPFVLIMTGLLLGWAIWRANGIGYLLNQEGKFRTFSQFWPIFIPSLTGMIGIWATLSLNMLTSRVSVKVSVIRWWDRW